MIPLPRGATGFWDARAGPPSAPTDIRALRGAVHTAAQRLAGEVDGFEPAGVTPNFHLIVIRFGDDRVGVVCHQLLPWLALARPPDDGSMEPLTFRSDPMLAAALELVPPFRVLDRPTLDIPVEQLDLSTLDAGEREQITFWKPATLGELVFNWWD